MNLHGIAAPYVAAVNPLEKLSIQVSTGSTTGTDGKRTPSYADAVEVLGQVQALTFGDIQQLDGLNIQGVRHAVYINGQIDGLVRPDKKGGDLITRPDGTRWLVAHILEYWPDWTKAAITREL